MATLGSRSLGLLLAVGLLLNVAVAKQVKIVVTYRGKPLMYGRRSAPYRSQSTVIVPLRETARQIGATIAVEPNGKGVTLRLGPNTVYYEPGHHGYRLNGVRRNMRAASETKGARLFVPIRLFSEATAGRLHAEIR